ncbi:MAG TPA: FIST N-terminal domain-containing protein [Xanthobacteraceae bacterium]|nr:FIST N-terminal domain-containing protein [Xanthobacteraceae bacterium]
MQAHQLSWTETSGWRGNGDGGSENLVLFFGARQALACGSRYRELRTMFPNAHILGCSTGGQIVNDDVTDDEIAVATLRFDGTRLRLACEAASAPEDSRSCGEAIGRSLAAEDLAGVFVLSDGLNVNGSELVAGMTSVVDPRVAVTGGLAGDGAKFQETLVGADCEPRKQTVAAIGFYGSAVRIGHGSAGGWDEFGPRRRISRSRGNVLFELDGEPALDLYERYLGEDDVKGLPGTALLFPLRIRNPGRPDHDIVRTILAIDHKARSMTFAGDVPEGWVAQLMRGNFDRLAAGAAKAARQAAASNPETRSGDQVAVLVSCIGRRLLMGQHTIDEVEAANAELGSDVSRLGFYSYGEISPHSASGVCELHNQTMTVTTISEVAG